MSITAAVVRELLAAGVTGDALVMALERIELAEDRRSSAAKRQAAYRARKDAESVTRDAYVSPKEIPPTPPKEITPSTSLRSETQNAGARGSRIPETFVPDEAEAFRIGLTPAEARSESAKFVDYWRGKSGQDAVKRDWPATWRNWCRRALENRGSRGQAPPARQRSQNGFAAYALNLAAEDSDAAFDQPHDTPASRPAGGLSPRGRTQDPGVLDTERPDAPGGTYSVVDRH